jgi:enoyl-CoA hydratase
MDLLDNFKMEYMLGQRFIVDGNFCEGVRALLVDRGSKPVWKPATYSEVNSQKVDWFFTPRPEDKHFDLNAKL